MTEHRGRPITPVAATRRRLLQVAGAGTALSLAGCTSYTAGSGVSVQGSQDGSRVGDGELVLATTTSTYDTGLLGDLNPRFQTAFSITVKTVSQGTGAAIRTARSGDADVILVHARGAEDRFIRDGIGINRRDVMFNDFVIVGPEADPAGIAGVASATQAFRTVATAEATFLSRGDDSGTHKKEQEIWEQAGVDPAGSWYQETGKGMGETLVQATQADAYTLTDRGTYLSMVEDIDLVIHVQGPLQNGPHVLKNPYGVIPVNPAVHDVNYEAAMAYIGFLTSPRGQTAIGNYTANGTQLFIPNALSVEPPFSQYVPTSYDGPTARLSERTASRVDHPVPEAD